MTRLFALFGMTLACVACYGVPDTEYNPSFAASGRVVDPEGKPIEGILAELGDSSTTTNEDGWFYVGGLRPTLELRDVDGVAGGGEFVSRVINVASYGTTAELGDIMLQRATAEEAKSDVNE